MFGYAFSFGRSELNNGFIALGDFCIDPTLEDPFKGAIYAAFIFELSFATTATTIVSGAMAERYEQGSKKFIILSRKFTVKINKQFYYIRIYSYFL